MTTTAGTLTPEQQKTGRDRLARLWRPMLGLILPALAAAIWELVVYQHWASGRLVPPPSVIFNTFMLSNSAMFICGAEPMPAVA